ncbi:hypothetical protein BGZ92_002537 [Podila epicladia]|nr:hypothetical protein BGZ92_002537 [Podila epicladia]
MTLWRGLYASLVNDGLVQEDVHEQHFSGATVGGYIPDLIVFKDHKPPHAPQGGHANKGGSGNNSAQVPLSSSGVLSGTTKTSLRQGEFMDIYPDEDEDEAAESTSFITWLTQAYTPFMEQSRINNKGVSSQQVASAPSSQETTHEPVRYFTYQPYAGFSNQFYCMLRAMQIAKRLNRTLLIPPISSSSHDVSRRNQAWSDFFDLDEFQAKTGLKVVEYYDLRDKGGFRGPTGVRESGTSLGGYWVPPHLIADPNNDKRYGRPLKTRPKRKSLKGDQMHSERYQHSFGTGAGAVDMSFPCHVTCGFGTKRSLDYTAKGFMRQWGFEFKKLTLPTIVMSENATDNANLPESLRTKALPMDQTRDYDRIIQALEHETLRDEPFLCITNTYKIQVPRGPEDLGIGSVEFTEFGQFLKFQPKLIQVVDEYLEKVLGKAPESRVSYPKDTFWIHLPPPPSLVPVDRPPMDAMAPPVPVPSQPPQEPSTDSDVQGPPVVVSARQEPLIKHTYFMLHIRRGDFETYCKDKVDVLQRAWCLPTNERYLEIVRELQTRNRNETVNGVNATRIPVFVATNESAPEKLQELRELGLQVLPGEQDGEEWRVINHMELQTVERLGPYGPVVLDQVLMAEAEAVLGVKLSTFSRVAEYRQRDWYGRRIMYV